MIYPRLTIFEKILKNPRNAASGTLKMQDSKVVASRKLDCILYFLLGENLPYESHFENMKEAGKWGFKISPYMEKHRNIDEVMNYLAH